MMVLTFKSLKVDISKASMLCALLESIVLEEGAIDKKAEASKVRNFITQAFIFCYLWSIGGNIIDISREAFELFVREQFETNADAQ